MKWRRRNGNTFPGFGHIATRRKFVERLIVKDNMNIEDVEVNLYAVDGPNKNGDHRTHLPGSISSPKYRGMDSNNGLNTLMSPHPYTVR